MMIILKKYNRKIILKKYNFNTSIRMYLHVYYLYTPKDKHLYIACYIIVISLYISVTREKFICVISLVDRYPRSKPQNLTDTPR